MSNFETLSLLHGKFIKLIIDAKGFVGYLDGTLSRKNCAGEDFVVESKCGGRVVFDAATFDHLNDIDPNFVFVFIKSGKETCL